MTGKNQKSPLPLRGIRVLDATHILAGPFCSMILADMGAEVVKIERPGAGDRSRSNGPFVRGPDGRQVSTRFLLANRNKKSVTLDLRNPLSKSAFEAMVRVSDVVLDNWGPGALQRLGLGFDHLSQLNPGLIYASITGYGDSPGLRGPYSSWPANNHAIQGMAGWMEVTGPPDGPPYEVGDNVGDTVPGVWTALGVLLALETRRQTGWGQHVDMAMYECMVAHTTASMAYYRATGEAAGRDLGQRRAKVTVRARDGYVALTGEALTKAMASERWTALWRLIGREDLLQDPRYMSEDVPGTTGEFYAKHFVPAIEAWSRDLSMLEAVQKLMEIGFSAGMVQNTQDLDQCPHLQARQMFLEIDDTVGGTFRAARTPIRLTACEDTPNTAPPALGAHNEEVLCGIGGLTPRELAQLRTEGAV